MRSRKISSFSRVLAVLSAASLLSFGALAFAQGDSTSSTPTSTELSGQGLSSAQKQAVADKTVQELDGGMKRVLKLIESAGQKKDVILLNCLNDKLQALKVLQKVAVDAQLGLAEAVARENVDLEEHNFQKIFIAGDQGGVVAAEADACVGQVGTSFPGKINVVLRYDGETEPDLDFGAAPGGNTRPPDASPFF